MFARRSGLIIVAPLALALLTWYYFIWPLTVLFILAFVVFLVFFRDPRRRIGKGIVAVADGVVRDLSVRNDRLLISTFMNLHNVHVNRAPIRGRVIGLKRRKGGYWPAFHRKADANSCLMITMRTKIGIVRIKQIAGTFAWRIAPYIRKGRIVKKGERIGIIRFGSRVDLELPASRVKSVVKVSDKILAGKSTVAGVVNEMDE
jgi:phosphatidylserine decarboxylase